MARNGKYGTPPGKMSPKLHRETYILVTKHYFTSTHKTLLNKNQSRTNFAIFT